MKKLLALILALLMVFSMVACSSSSQEDADEETEEAEETVETEEDEYRVLRVGTTQTGGGFDPTSNQLSDIGSRLVYDRVCERQPDGSIGVSSVCESYEWVDSTTIVFQLKDNVYFSDGDQLVGEDIIYAFYIQSLGMQANNYSCIDFDACTVSDDGLTVTIYLSTEYGPLESLLGNPSILNKSAVEDLDSDDESWWDQPIGTGPYEVVENISGSHTTYKLRDDYWDTEYEAEWDEIIVYYYSESTAMFIAFENGELDLVSGVGSSDVERLISGDTKLGESVAYELVGTNNVNCLGLSSYCEYFDDIKVREAIAHAIDVEAVGIAAYGSMYKTSESVLAETCNYYVAVGSYEYDTEYALQCMAESSYPDGFTLHVTISNSDTTIWTVLQGQLAVIGITLEMDIYDQSTCIPIWQTEDGTDMILINVKGGNSTRDPYSALTMTNETHTYYAGRIMDDEYQEYFKLGMYSTDTEVRAEAYEAIQLWCYENFQAIPLVEDMACYAYNTDVISSCEFFSATTPNLRYCYAATGD